MNEPITSMKGAFDLTGKNAVITGGNRGLGLGVGTAFCQQGANVAILCRDQKKAEEAIAELSQYGTKVKAYSCDVTDLSSCEAAVAAVISDFGDIDILVNNAGVSCTKDFLDDEGLVEWYKVLNTDLNGTVHMTYAVGHAMRDAGHGGCIINITSNAAYMVNKTQAMASYSTAKAAGNHFTHCMACELGKYGIRVNAICPGFTRTELAKHIPEEGFAYIAEQNVSDRWGEPIEIGALAVYLASPAAGQVTGSEHVIDGGYMLRC